MSDEQKAPLPKRDTSGESTAAKAGKKLREKK